MEYNYSLFLKFHSGVIRVFNLEIPDDLAVWASFLVLLIIQRVVTMAASFLVHESIITQSELSRRIKNSPSTRTPKYQLGECSLSGA